MSRFAAIELLLYTSPRQSTACSAARSGCSRFSLKVMKCHMKAQWGMALTTGTGAFLTILGALFIALWPDIYQRFLSEELQLSESSTSYRLWRGTPVPLYIQFYFFNWTNPADIENAKPILKEMGPYRFNEFHEKVNISFHPENSTVSFRQVRRWVFDQDNSQGNLDDQVTTLNIPPITAAFVARSWGVLMQTPLSLAITQLETRHVTKTVRELLFDGYEDPLISLAGKLPALAKIDIPFDRFGWFYERNNSDVYDGHFNMDTGADDISKVGRLRYWNYANRTNYFSSHCGDVNGSAGELWPPGRDKTSISMFSPDLCRSLKFNFTEEVQVHDVPGFRYSGGAEIVDNGTIDSGNECFCGGECLPVGVVNASSCRYGAPAFVSYPHFYMADPYYRDLVHGLNPNKEKHQFYVTLEPSTGIPLDVAARFQINILLQPRKLIRMYRRVPRVFFPIIWFEQRATMTPALAAEMRGLLILPVVATVLGIAILVTGATLLVTVIARRIMSRKASVLPKKDVRCSEGRNTTDETGIEDSHPLKQTTETTEVKQRVQLTVT